MINSIGVTNSTDATDPTHSTDATATDPIDATVTDPIDATVADPTAETDPIQGAISSTPATGSATVAHLDRKGKKRAFDGSSGSSNPSAAKKYVNHFISALKV